MNEAGCAIVDAVYDTRSHPNHPLSGGYGRYGSVERFCTDELREMPDVMLE